MLNKKYSPPPEEYLFFEVTLCTQFQTICTYSHNTHAQYTLGIPVFAFFTRQMQSTYESFNQSGSSMHRHVCTINSLSSVVCITLDPVPVLGVGVMWAVLALNIATQCVVSRNILHCL